MKILLVYSYAKGTTAHYIEEALKKMGETVHVLDASKVDNLKTGLGKIAPKLFHLSIKDAVSIIGEKPDIVIEIEGDPSYHLSGLKSTDIPSVYWAIDSHRMGSRKNQLEICRDFDFFFVAQKDYVEMFHEAGARAIWLPLAADPSIHKTHDVPKTYDVAYVGGLNPKQNLKRLELLDQIKKEFKLNIGHLKYYDEMAEVYSSAKIGFNKSIGNDINMRLFEIMSCGTMLLTDQIEGNGIDELFVDKKHLVFYREHNMLDLIRYYLKNDKEREEIAKAGQKEILAKHTYAHRADTMLNTVRKF